MKNTKENIKNTPYPLLGAKSHKVIKYLKTPFLIDSIKALSKLLGRNVMDNPTDYNVSQSFSIKTVTVIGASTGGPPVINYIMSNLDPHLPTSVLIVQHMPPKFTNLFAERLDEVSLFKVKEAEDGDKLKHGHAYVAPGGKHMLVEAEGLDLVIRLIEGPKIYGVKPAVDVTLLSLAKYYGKRCIATILTGMGFDGVQGCLAIKKLGGIVIAQDSVTAVVFGMPRAVIDLGLADFVLPYHMIPSGIERAIKLVLAHRR